MAKDDIQNQIRRLRFDHGEMTQQQLADKAGVTRQTIIAIEAGKYAPSLPLAFRIAAAFSVPLEDVFQYHANGQPPKADGKTGDPKLNRPASAHKRGT